MMEFNGVKFYGREGTTDYNVMKEVFSGVYRKVSLDFDVRTGETWLDLGANIGAFAMYAIRQGAKSLMCWEPEPETFALLQKNVPIKFCFNKAVSASKEPWLEFFGGSKGKFSRGSLIYKRSLVSVGRVRNYWAGNLRKLTFDGVKMDIEGAEGPIIDQWLLPRCDKLVLEYHTSRDDSLPNLLRRVNLLRDHFRQVHIPPEYQRAIDSKAKQFKSFFDRNIFCWEAK